MNRIFITMHARRRTQKNRSKRAQRGGNIDSLIRAAGMSPLAGPLKSAKEHQE